MLLEKIFEINYLIRILNKLLNDEDKKNLLVMYDFVYLKRRMLSLKRIYDYKKEDRYLIYCDCLQNIRVTEFIKYPKFIKSLTFNVEYITDQKVLEDFEKNFYYYIPESITKLHFQNQFYANIKSLNFKLKSLTLPKNYFGSLEIIPKTVNKLTIYNLNDVIPDFIKKLTLIKCNVSNVNFDSIETLVLINCKCYGNFRVSKNLKYLSADSDFILDNIYLLEGVKLTYLD